MTREKAGVERGKQVRWVSRVQAGEDRPFYYRPILSC